MGLAERIIEELPPEARQEIEGRKRVANANASASPLDPSDPFHRARAVPMADVLRWLGLMNGDQPVCPGCGESDAAVAIFKNGLKCYHKRCHDKGIEAGFRTTVDVVSEAKHCEPREAVNAMAERFGFAGIRPRAKSEANATQEEPIKLTPVAELLRPAIDRARARKDGKERPIPVAHEERGRNLGGGYWPGVHFVISGTGVGKSQLMVEDIAAAAKTGVPCLYIGLELEAMQVALRFIAEEAKVSWSRLYLGKCSDYQLELAEKAADSLAVLPLYADFSGPMGWPMSRLDKAVAALREKHPDGPILVVLDYLQLIAAEPDQQGRSELRERIGAAAYLGRAIAIKYNAAIVIVSSTARANYSLLSGDAIRAAGITMQPQGDSFALRKVVLNPDVLVGAGKESGEIEASADSVTVLLRWPTLLDGARVVLAVTAKGRATGAGWSALVFDHGTRFLPLTVNAMTDLPELPSRGSRGGSGGSGTGTSVEDAILDAVGRTRNLKSRNDIADLPGLKFGRKAKLDAIRRLVDLGRLARGSDGSWVVLEPEGGTSGAA